eukprot:TRINITY_DN1095_c0_g1_i1.p1 TRINITY_DN1095_c0_g1~~TRINITY_DN1095_c0_g1_i1.p1  ORF type:complete len:364 (+),score=154.03 TRINITY_DN1095_c0_g1_i1:1-1092(+)
MQDRLREFKEFKKKEEKENNNKRKDLELSVIEIKNGEYGTFKGEREGELILEIENDNNDNYNIDDNNVNSEEEQKQEKEIKSFLKECGEIKDQLQLMRRNIKLIKDSFEKQALHSTNNINDNHNSNSNSNSNPNPNPSSTTTKAASDLEQLLSITNSIALQIRNRIKMLCKVTKNLPPTSIHKKLRANAQTTLTQKFSTLLQEYMTLQAFYRDRFRDKLQRQAEIVQPGITREEVDKIIAQGNTNFFASKILNDPKRTQAINAVLFMQEQQKDLLELEKSLNQLNNLFIDLATLIEIQDDGLSQLQQNLEQAHEAAIDAVDALTEVEKAIRKKRRKKCLCIGGITLVILLMAGAVAAPLAMFA